MRIAFGLISWGVLAAMVIIAGEPHLSAAQIALLAAGVVLTMINMLILLLCADAWHELCEVQNGREGIER